MSNKLDALCVIKDEMLTDKNVDARTVLNAAKFAENDKYLYELMVDYMSVLDPDIKKMLMEEVLNYTEEVIRQMRMRNEI
jgi:hypothetical protein